MSEPATETRIDRYILEEPLGAGGFSTVYRARHSLIGNHVAFKLLKPEHTRRPVTIERFLREAQTAASIGNPHIVKVLDCGTSADGEMFLVMELLEGRELTDLIVREGPLELGRSVDIVLQVLSALESAHAAGIVHRDIKPDNIFLTTGEEGRPDFVKLLDFGISKILDSAVGALTTAGEVLGTPLYMAPEQIMGSTGVDHRVDVYAVSAVLYHMLSGSTPHKADTLPALAHMIISETPKPLSTYRPDLPADLSAVVATGMAHEPEQRWQTVAAFADVLRRFSSGGQPSPTATPPTGTPNQWGAPASTGTWPTSAPQPGTTNSRTGFTNTGSTGVGWSEGPVTPPQGATTGPGVTTGGGGTERRRFPAWLIFVGVGLGAMILGGITVGAIALIAHLYSEPDPAPPDPGPNTTDSNTTTGPAAASLRLGQPVTGMLPMGQQLDYPLIVDQRSMVTVSLQSAYFDTYLYVLRNGVPIGSDDDGGNGLNSRLSLWLEPGQYTVRVASFQNSGGGQFILHVIRTM